MTTGTLMAASTQFASSTYALQVGDFTISGYAAFYSLIVNLAICVVVTAALRWSGLARRSDDSAAAEDRNEETASVA
jgi:hypothetical protein